ncbi:MAG: SRPBCC domain-containing protein [Pseudomonadota bacterium]
MTAPIKKSVDVPLRPAEAFDLFTARMDTWWPLDTHGVGADNGAPSKDIRFDAEEGGAVTEILPGGREARWGTVTEYTQGSSFAMTWHPGRDEAEATHVSVTFLPLGNGCRVELVHCGFEARADGTKASTMYAQGWDHLIGTLFARAAAELVTA